MNVPYKTKSGVQIGKYYQPPKYVEQDCDMINLQSYLIHDPARLKREYWTNKILIGISLFVLTLVLLKGCSA